MALTSPPEPTPLLDVLRLTTDDGANILGPTLNLRVTRGATRGAGVADDLGPGSLSGTVRDATVSPVTNEALRPKHRIQLAVLLDGVVWKNLASMRLERAEVAQVSKTDPRVDVSLEALDLVAQLANDQYAGQAYNGRMDQRAYPILFGRGISYFPIDASEFLDGPGEYKPITPSESKSLLEWVTLLRDTAHGIAYVDQDDELFIHHSSALPGMTSSPGDFASDDTDDEGFGYKAIDFGFATDHVTNVLTVNRFNLDEENGTKAYGPYRATDSAGTWGEKADEVTVTDGSPSAHAEAFLSNVTQPTDLVKSLTFDVDPDDPRTLYAAAMSLYRVVRIKRGTHDRLYRLIGVEHQLTAKKWTVTWIVRPLEAASAIDFEVPAAGPDTGPADIAVLLSTHAARHRTTPLAIPSGGAPTSVAFDAFTVEDTEGLPYSAVDRWFTATRAGLYQINAAIAFEANATGSRTIGIAVNGVVRRYSSHQNAGAGTATTADLSLAVRLAAGDKVSIGALHNAGAPLDLLGTSTTTAVDITYLGT